MMLSSTTAKGSRNALGFSWPCVLVAAALGCHSDGRSPTSPTLPPQLPSSGPAITFLFLDAASIGRGTQAALLIGQSHQMRARGSTGQGVVDVAARWHSDNPMVLTTTPEGQITGVANGWAKLVATYDTLSATIDVRVASDYGGDWSGTLRLVHCDSPDPLFCGQQFPPGTQRPLQLSIAMDRLFAYVRFRWEVEASSLSFSESVEVGEDGSLAFAGRTYDASGFEAPLVIASWRSNLTVTNRMVGRVTLIHGLRDPARTEWELVDVVRVPR